MAHGDYYNPTNKSVVDGAIVYAEDINKINTAIDAALDQVASDLDDIEASIGDGGVASKDWATEDAGTRPDPVLDLYSSRAYAAEAKGWASAAGTVTEARTGVPLAGSSSAKTQAAAAAASASTASGHATTASNAAIAAAASASTASGFSNSASGFATIASGFAEDASGFAEDASNYADAAADSEAAITSIYSTFTAAGIALLNDTTAAEQRQTLGLNNVDNTSDLNKPISTATQSALNLKASLASPVLTGNPVAPTRAATESASDNIATTAYVRNFFSALTNSSAGYQYFPPGTGSTNAIVIQWGYVITHATANTEINHSNAFALAFDALLSITFSDNVSNTGVVTKIYSPTTTGFRSKSSGSSLTIRYIAIGYITP